MEERAAYAGIDTHKDTHMLAVLDGRCQVMWTRQFPTGQAGYDELEKAIGDPSVLVGVEGSASFGAGVTAHLLSCGYEVQEVIHPKKSQRRRGKSDPIDAIAAAKNVAAGDGLPVKSYEGAVGEIRWLMVAREQAVRQTTALSSVVDALIVTAPEPMRAKLSGVEGEARMRKLAKSRPANAFGRTLKTLSKRWVALDEDAESLRAEIEALVIEHYPALIGAPGIGAIAAARLVVAAGANPERMGSEAAFSMLCGTSPIPVSSGRTDRFRLNRGGDRQANRAIHEIATARMSHDARTQEFVARKTSEGKTKKEAVRCLCRYIAREAFKLMTGPQEPLPDVKGLVIRRKSLGLRQADVAGMLGLTMHRVSKIERGVTIDGPMLRLYDSLLAEMEDPCGAPGGATQPARASSGEVSRGAA